MAFRGMTVDVPLAMTGMTGTKNVLTAQPSDLLTARNVTYVNGTVEKEYGVGKLNASAVTGEILGGFDWWPTGALQRTVVGTTNGDLLRDTGDGSFGTTLKSGLTVDRPVFFAEGGAEVAANNKKLFVCTGNDVVQVLDGDGVTTGDLTTPPADWTGSNQPKCMVLHKDRLWGAGNANDPHRVYYSSATDHEDFGTGGSIAIYSGVGDGIERILSWNKMLLVFKYPKGIFYVDTSDVTASNWAVRRVSENIGTLSTMTVAAGIDDVFYVDQSGAIRTLSATQEFTEVDNRAVSDLRKFGPFIREKADFSERNKWALMWHPYHNELAMVMPSVDTAYPTYKVVADFNDAANPAKFRVNYRDQISSFWLTLGSDSHFIPVFGDDDGYVWEESSDTRVKDGNGYDMEIETVPTTLNYADQRLGLIEKNGEFVELDVEVSDAALLQGSVLWDGQVGDTFTLNLPASGDAIGSFVIGTSKLSRRGIASVRTKIYGSGRRVAFRFKNSGTQNVSIAGLRIGFNTGSEDLRGTGS